MTDMPPDGMDTGSQIGQRVHLHMGEVAGHAARALCDYCGLTNPEDYNIACLITDLGHFCDREGLDFRRLVRRAREQWEKER